MPRGASSPTVRRTRKAKAEAEASSSAEETQATPADTTDNAPVITHINTPTNDNDTDKEDTTMTAATDEKVQAPSFDFVIEAAPDDYEPERKNPGRTRTPSPFDGPLVEFKGKGWMKVPYEGEEMKQVVLRELNKAKQFNGLGLDLNVTETHVEWKSRDLQKRAPRKPKAGAGQAELAENQGELDPDGDNDQ